MEEAAEAAEVVVAAAEAVAAEAEAEATQEDAETTVPVASAPAGLASAVSEANRASRYPAPRPAVTAQCRRRAETVRLPPIRPSLWPER